MYRLGRRGRTQEVMDLSTLLAIKRFTRKIMSNLVEHAKTELKAAGLLDKDSDYDGMLGEAALELVEVFDKQGHSGLSAPYVASIVNKLFMFKPFASSHRRRF